MEAVYIKILNMSWTAGWMILAVILFRLIFKKAPKAVVCVLWGLVALRLMIPFSFESTLSLIPSSEPIPENIMLDATPAIESGIAIMDDSVNAVLKEEFAPKLGASVNPMQIQMFIYSLIWLFGVACILLYGVISYLLLKRKVAASILVEKNIKMCDGISSPFILGFIRPIIYLPSDIPEDRMEHVILHENAHLKRKDHWWKPLGFLLLAIYWFHPLVWIAYWLLCRDIEYACDECVIKRMDADGVKKYSSTLLSCSISRRSLMMCPLAFGEVGVKQRIKSVLSFKRPTVWIISAAILVSLVLGVTLLTNPKQRSDQYDLWLVEGTEGEIAAFTSTERNDIYFYGVSEVKVKIDGAFVDLADALERDEYVIEKLLQKASEDCSVVRNGAGSVLYHCDDYALLEMNLKVSMLGIESDSESLDYTYDGGIYFGTPDMTIKDIERLWLNRKIPGFDIEAMKINLGSDGTNEIVYGGTAPSGLDAADTVKKYYELLKKQGFADGLDPYQELYCDVMNKRTESATIQNITLLEFTHCQVVNSSMLRKSDFERFKDLYGNYYACCYVQTADKILCNEDGALGLAGEEVVRQYSYFLVRESKDSEWKIYDCGYPPFYIPSAKAEEYSLRVVQDNDHSLTKITDGSLREHLGFDIHYCGLSKVEVYSHDKYIDLSEALKSDARIVDGILNMARLGVEQGSGDYYKDGGTMVYNDPNYTIIKKHALTGTLGEYDETMYIGQAGLTLNDLKDYS